ncbi:MAG: hypothetical protein JXB85_08345 [Anaerolineales bacterium]|nr:hypothetical protein [Anaerolineales bacterium]
MPDLVPLEPVDYLVIGHLARDLTPEGSRLGGTAAYSALTARALGLRVGVVTAWGGELPLKMLDGIRIQAVAAGQSTTFENLATVDGRRQYVHHVAPDILPGHIPPAWQRAAIIHVGPIAGEARGMIDADLAPSILGLTPQGWLRTWNDDHLVHPCDWPAAGQVLARVGAAVISLEDVAADEDRIEAMSLAARILAVTEGPAGARLYWNGDLRRFRAPQMDELDATGAGDIFAAAFFIRLHATRDPWEAARFATRLAAFSVTRPGLQGIPSQAEIKTCLVEVF